MFGHFWRISTKLFRRFYVIFLSRPTRGAAAGKHCISTSSTLQQALPRFSRHLYGQAKQCRNYNVCMGIRQQIAFSKIEFCAIYESHVKILSRRLCSPSLMNVGWIEDAQLIFLFMYFFPRRPFDLHCQTYRQMYGKLEKLIDRFQVTSSLSKIQIKSVTTVFILIRHKRRYIFICLQFYSSIACLVWKPERFEFQSYGSV